VSRHRRGRTPDEARLVQRFRRLAPQQKALLLAMRAFSDENDNFDRALWRDAFFDQDPVTIMKVSAVTGLYDGLVNHLAEMLNVAARLRGLDIAQRETRPSSERLASDAPN
jgi:hypothetical protein